MIQLAYDDREGVVFVLGSDTYSLREVIRYYGGWWDKLLRVWRLPAHLDTMYGFIKEAESRNASLSMSRSYLVWLEQETARQDFLSLIRMGKEYEASFPAKTQAYPFQESGTGWLIRCGRGGMLLDEMGLGKTRQAIVAACYIFCPVVIVCPNTVKSVWADEIEKHGPGRNLVTIPSGIGKVRAEIVARWKRNLSDAPGFKDADRIIVAQLPWLILNYESLLRMEGEFLSAADDSILILDEAHRAKNGRAKVTKILLKAKPRMTWLLTGTPVANRLEDLYSLTQLIRPGILGPSWFHFDHKYIRRDKFGGISGYQYTEEVQDKLSTVALGRKKAHVLDLPEKIFVTREVELGNEERKAYNRMKDGLFSWIEENVRPGQVPTSVQAATFSERFLRLRQIADGFLSRDAKESPEWVASPSKIMEAIQVWDDAGRPRCVVWCQFIPLIDRVMAEFCRAKAQVFQIDGRVEQADREGVIAAWSKAEGSILVAQMQVAGVGINLQSAAFEIFIDIPLTPKDRDQCVDRCHRIGQSSAVTIVDVLAKDTIDKVLRRRLASKMVQADMVVVKSFPQMTREELLQLLG